MASLHLTGEIQCADAGEYTRLVANLHAGVAPGLTLVNEHPAQLKVDISVDVDVPVPDNG